MTPASPGQISFFDIHDEVANTPASECSLNDTDVLAMNGGSAGAEHSISQWYETTADPSLEDWNKVVSSIPWFISAAGTASSEGSYTQVVWSLQTDGSWDETAKFNGSQSVTTRYWSPIFPSETSADYEIKWSAFSGTTPDAGWAENTWRAVNLGSIYLSMTDTAIDNGARSGRVAITLRSTGAVTTEHVCYFDLSCNYTS